MDSFHCCSNYSFGIWIYCCLFCFLSYSSLPPSNYRFLGQSTVHTSTPYSLIRYPHPPIIHYLFGLILTFVSLLMIWPQFSIFWPFRLLSQVFSSYHLFHLLVPLYQIPHLAAKQPHLAEHFLHNIFCHHIH